MRPNSVRKLAVWFLTMGTVWLTAPLRVLAEDSKTVDQLFQSKTPGQAPAVPAAGSGDPSVIGSTVTLIFALGLIIALIYLLIRFLSSRTKQAQGGAIQSIGAQPLANNRSVHMVSVGGKVYLLGVGENVTLIDTITDPQQVEDLRASSLQPAASPVVGLQELIGRLRPKKETQTEEIELNDLSFDAALREKINALKEKRQEADQWQEGRE